MANTRRVSAPRWWTTAWGSTTELRSKSNVPYGGAASIIRLTLSDGTNAFGVVDADWISTAPLGCWAANQRGLKTMKPLKRLTNAPVAVALAFLLVGAPAVLALFSARSRPS